MMEELLDEIGARPPEVWQRMLKLRLTDDTEIRHALIWLHATREVAQGRPDLGERYRLERVLDRGTTATVWQAHDRKLNRTVAVKAFHAEPVGEILAEARAASEVVSDHVVRIYDVHDDHIVMELIGENDDVRGELAPGSSAAHTTPRDLDEAVRWVRDVARGVHDAHLRNVFHRDLKPHNVLITPFSRRAKIADFGLAVGESTPATTAGLVLETCAGPARIVGTPAFMSPEQARGLPVKLDPRDTEQRAALVKVDVWGLGAIACTLATGQPPWPDPDTAWECAARGDVPWVDDARIPGRLRRVIDRALAVDPKDRYASAAEVADELDAYLARRPTSRDRGIGTRSVLWIRRNPQIALMLVVAALLAATLVATLGALDRLHAEQARLEADRARLVGNIAEAHEELAQTEVSLRDRTAVVADLQRAASDARADYTAILASKEKLLQSADRTTRALADDLTRIRAERDTAETARDMYEGFWERARSEAAAVAAQLEAADGERDQLRGERDRALKDRDAARAARTRAEGERDAAEAERVRVTAIRRRLEIELAKLTAELTTRITPDAQGP